MIGNVENRSTKLGQEYADDDHKLCTTPSTDVSKDAKIVIDN